MRNTCQKMQPLVDRGGRLGGNLLGDDRPHERAEPVWSRRQTARTDPLDHGTKVRINATQMLDRGGPAVHLRSCTLTRFRRLSANFLAHVLRCLGHGFFESPPGASLAVSALGDRRRLARRGMVAPGRTGDWPRDTDEPGRPGSTPWVEMPWPGRCAHRARHS